ncbi:hypothetical protein B0A48_18054 [Cryoendolithus antarcticus]|uniref:Uncharacterized protein n=1 Tax=Cryoendolithus antarcticus TaxID=1507870 RepID=A0A1V8SAQ2_9PEZI|nr:hypothetical protein B0A48_18054 [Cryoendolithus antarcticus]
MSTQQNVWQAARTSRTPTSRSGTASPSQQGNPTQPPRTKPQQANNAWAQRSSESQDREVSSSNGRPESSTLNAQQEERSHVAVNGFNTADVKALLNGGSKTLPAAYMVDDNGGIGRGGAWGSKPNHMASGQPFLVQLAKQIATLEGGG